MPYEEDKLTAEESGPEKPDSGGPSNQSPGPGVKSELTQSSTTAEPGAEPGAGPGSSRHEAAKKIEELFNHTENRLNQIDGQLEQLPKMVQNTVVQVLQKFQEEQAKQTGPGPTEEFSKMGKEEKMLMLAEFGKSLSEVISAWKGGSAEGPAGPDFKNIMADWGMKMFTFHLDNMAQSVYQIKLPPPPGVAERSLGPKTQPNFQTTNIPGPGRQGVHKFE